MNTSQVLLKFDSLFGNGPGQIPLGSIIVSAIVTVNTNNTGNGGSFNRMLVNWDETVDTWNTFAADVPDPELHQLPGTCAQFVIDRDGTIYQLVPLTTICRHTVGLNWTAIGIEHVGLGSDFDGATMPRALGDAAGLPRLIAALRHHGFDDAALRQITHENWLRVLERTWRPEVPASR